MPKTKKEANKDYYDKNREKIMHHLNEKRLCEACNQEYPQHHLYRHFKSMKHIQNLAKPKTT